MSYLFFIFSFNYTYVCMILPSYKYNFICKCNITRNLFNLKEDYVLYSFRRDIIFTCYTNIATYIILVMENMNYYTKCFSHIQLKWIWQLISNVFLFLICLGILFRMKWRLVKLIYYIMDFCHIYFYIYKLGVYI